MIYHYAISTKEEEFYNITAMVENALIKRRLKRGIAVVYCPHTTAGITINESADPDVTKDLLFALNQTYPDRPEFKHYEGNSSAHLKASVIGSSETIIIENGRLLLGTWQAIYLIEFDGPRTRNFYVKIVEE